MPLLQQTNTQICEEQKMKYVLGIDFGGGASKATLLSQKGEIAATSTVEYKTYYPKNGWVEQEPMDWYKMPQGKT